jgi:hypothetical protein
MNALPLYKNIAFFRRAMHSYASNHRKGQTFMTKKDNCFDYSIIKIPSDSIWAFFFKNIDEIKKEEIKIAQYVEIKNGKEEVYSSTIDHSYHEGFKVIVTDKAIVDKDLDDYYFTRKLALNVKRISIMSMTFELF